MSLDKQKVLLAQYKSHLADRRTAVISQYTQAWKKLTLRLLMVVLVMVLLAGIIQVSRRLTLRHVEDPNRRLAGITLRLLTLFAILVNAAFGLASDLAPLATYFGLVTAGVAVALQNVIVASAGYLLLAGKRGIRIGAECRSPGSPAMSSTLGCCSSKSGKSNRRSSDSRETWRHSRMHWFSCPHRLAC